MEDIYLHEGVSGVLQRYPALIGWLLANDLSVRIDYVPDTTDTLTIGFARIGIVDKVVERHMVVGDDPGAIGQQR
jgi:hypothetical protein